MCSTTSTMLCNHYDFALVGSTTVSDSPVPQLLGTNCVPSNLENSAIRQTVGDAHAALSHLGSEITRVQAVLDQLLHDHTRLQAHADEHSALLSPARRLPHDIVAEIFLRCVPVRPWYRNSLDVTRPPWLLGHICSGWRRVALSTPRLWSALRISLNDGNEMRPDYCAALVGAHLERAGACPLTLALDLAGESVTTAHQLVDTLVRRAHCWQHVRLTLPTALYARFAAATNRLPLLQTLELDLPRAADALTPAHPLAVFACAPRLRDVTLNDPVAPAALVLPWAQLTRCHAEFDDVEQFLHIARQALRLVECAVEAHSSGHRLHGGAAPAGAVLPALRVFRITVLNGDVAALLDALTAPVLHDLEISLFSADNIFWPHAPFTAFLARSACVLQRLVLRHMPLADYELLTCLRAAPLLRELVVYELELDDDLHYPVVSDRVVSALTHRGAREGWPARVPCLVPRLRVLELSGRLYVDDHALVDMVRSRWRPGHGADDDSPLSSHIASLESARLHIHRAVDARAIGRFEELREGGLDLTLYNSLPTSDGRPP